MIDSFHDELPLVMAAQLPGCARPKEPYGVQPFAKVLAMTSRAAMRLGLLIRAACK
jgi:hypothetical protein